MHSKLDHNLLDKTMSTTTMKETGLANWIIYYRPISCMTKITCHFFPLIKIQTNETVQINEFNLMKHPLYRRPTMFHTTYVTVNGLCVMVPVINAILIIM